MNRKDLAVRSDDTDDNFKNTLKVHHLKITPQRIAIYNELIKSKEHPSASVIFESVRKLFPNISFDTVNRTLVTFAELKLIKVVEGSLRGRRFDPNLGRHHHFVCVKCGRITDFNSKEFDDLKISDDIKNKFKILGHRVIIEGICDECSKKLPHNKI